MVEYMKRVFGDHLLSDYIDGDVNRNQLPSPKVMIVRLIVGCMSNYDQCS